jgi:hypothetical protein
MSPLYAENRSQEYYESAEPPEESNLPWLDESDIIAHEYDSDDPWIDEG